VERVLAARGAERVLGVDTLSGPFICSTRTCLVHSALLAVCWLESWLTPGCYSNVVLIDSTHMPFGSLAETISVQGLV
jgi:hypothetical protein